MTKIELIDEIQKSLIELECNGVSQRSMAKITGISRYKIGRFIKRKTGTDTSEGLDFDDIFTLVKFIKNDKNSTNVLQSDDNQYLLNVFDSFSDSELARRNTSIELSDEILEDFDNFVILTLASNSVTVGDIESNILPHNRYKIEKLLEREIIHIFDDGQVNIRNADFVRLPIRILHLHLPKLISSFYSPARIGNGSNLIRLAWGSVDTEGMKQIREVSIEMGNQVDKIICDRPGDNSVFYSIVFDKFNGGSHEKTI